MEAVPVSAEPRTQADLPILVGNCPKCNQPRAVTGPGVIICECGTLLRFHDKNKPQPAK